MNKEPFGPCQNLQWQGEFHRQFVEFARVSTYTSAQPTKVHCRKALPQANCSALAHAKYISQTCYGLTTRICWKSNETRNDNPVNDKYQPKILRARKEGSNGSQKNTGCEFQLLQNGRPVIEHEKPMDGMQRASREQEAVDIEMRTWLLEQVVGLPFAILVL